VAAERSLPAAEVRGLHDNGLERQVAAFFAEAQRRAEFRRDLPTSWMVATLHALVHAAAVETEAGRLDPAVALDTLATTMLTILTPS